MRIDQICRDCELESSGILHKVDLRVLGISNFDVILSIDWLTIHRVVIGCDSRRITAYTWDGIRVTFHGEKHDALPDHARLQVEWTVDELASEPYPRG